MHNWHIMTQQGRRVDFAYTLQSRDGFHSSKKINCRLFFFSYMFQSNDFIDIENCCNEAQFLNNEIIIRCLTIKMFV